MSENKIRDISNISNSTVIIGNNNQSTNNIQTIEDIFLEAKNLIIYYEEEQEQKQKELNKRLVQVLCFLGFVFIISILCYFFFPEETLFSKIGFTVGCIGTGIAIYTYFDNLKKPNQTQRDYSDRYSEIIRILEYNRRQDLVSELAFYKKSHKK